MSMCCTRVPWIMASKHYYWHASLSGICSIEILGESLNQTNVGAAGFKVQIQVGPFHIKTFSLPTRICYVKVCLEIETKSFIYNVCCHVTVTWAAATHLLLFIKGWGLLRIKFTSNWRNPIFSVCYVSPRIPIVEGCSPISKRHLFFHHDNHIPFTLKTRARGIQRGGWDGEERRKNSTEKGGTRRRR